MVIKKSGFLKQILTLLLLVGTSMAVMAQDLSTADLKNVKADELSDAAISSYYQKAKASNLSEDDIASLLLQRGLPQAELTKLQARLKSGSRTTDTNPASKKVNFARKQNPVTNEVYEIDLTEKELLVAGSQVFNSPSLTFEPNLKLATPKNYVLAEDDEVVIQVFGQSEATYKVTISAEGTISIPNVGPIALAGLSIDAAYQRIKSRFQNSIYTALATGQTKMTISLGNIRSIKVTAVGQVKKPGVYTVSSLSTAFNVLYLCGGPNFEGTFRDIHVVRNGKIVGRIDVYKFLFGGSTIDNILLQDNDVVYVPFYSKRVLLQGELRKPGYYEAVANESFATMLQYAGGFSDSAYKKSVSIVEYNGVQKNVRSLAADQFANHRLLGGETITIGKVEDNTANAIFVQGAVIKPGLYDAQGNKTLTSVIKSAGGLQPFAYKGRVLINRTSADLSKNFISVNLADVLDKKIPDPELFAKDVITISSVDYFRSQSTVAIEGEVREPLTIAYSKGVTVQDLLVLAKGFTDAASKKRIEVARRRYQLDTNSTVSADTSLVTISVFQVENMSELSSSEGSFPLMPNDVVYVRTNPAVQPVATVTLEGEVLFPGKYTIKSKGEKISEIISRAGGLTAVGDIASASLMRRRNTNLDTLLKSNVIKQLSKTKDTLIQVANTNTEYEIVALNIESAVANYNSTENLPLVDGDRIIVPSKSLVVKVKGEVLQPSQMSFHDDRKMNYYIDRAGGFSAQAYKKKAFVVSANGNARTIRRFLFFKSYPSIHPGDEIVVPPLPDRSSKKLSTGEIIGFSSAIASLATVVLAILRN